VSSRDRVTRSSVPARRPPEPSPEDVRRDAAAGVLELQRGVGNAAVAKLLRKAPEPPRAGGWNETAREVAGTLRIPIEGIKHGNQDEDVGGGSKEGAAGKAIVVVPDGDDLAAAPDVLLFFHGMGNLGYRERLRDDSSRGPAGSVHDVEADRMEQQLAHSGRNIVGVLPQGTNAAIFGIGDPQAYLTEVLALAAAKLQTLRPDMKLPAAITPGRIIVAGHSGGGRAAVAAAKTLNATAPATDDEWAKAPPLFLFDGINGPNETNAIGDMMDQWLQADLARLTSTKDPDKLLDRRGIRLRSTHTSSDLYTATNLGGTYKTEAGSITIAPGRSLKGRIDAWFKANGAKLGAVEAKLRAQYDVPDAAVAGGHEATVGTGSLETDPAKRVATPPGITGASKAAGVPGYSGGGHLEDSLSRLPPDALRPPPPPPPKAALEDELEGDELYA
jgi:hypothetical protein